MCLRTTGEGREGSKYRRTEYKGGKESEWGLRLVPKVRVESSLHPTRREDRRRPEASTQGQSRREERRVESLRRAPKVRIEGRRGGKRGLKLAPKVRIEGKGDKDRGLKLVLKVRVEEERGDEALELALC